MFKIAKVEKPIFYVDRIMKEMEEFALRERSKISERFDKNVGTKKKDPKLVIIDKRKDLELEKIRFFNNRSSDQLKKISKRFPDFRKVDDVYIKLINTSETKVKVIQDALARLLWIRNMIDELTQNTEFKIKKAKTNETVGFIMKKYLGKVNSYYKKNKSFFEILESGRIFMNSLPEFKDIYTISIAGFPNVGKSTLMKKITGSDVEIKNYPFTTKGLMFGYLKENGKDIIQMIDTPGLLGREKTNPIEERAALVIRDFCSKVVFVVDFTQSCGFDIESQFKLLKKTAESEKDVIVYLSKLDLFNEETFELKNEFNNKLKKFKVFDDFSLLKKSLVDNYLKSLNKFDPKKLKVIR